jgi:hypothetical protein
MIIDSYWFLGLLFDPNIFIKHFDELLPSLQDYCAILFQRSIKKLHGFSPRASYTDRETAGCRRS